MIKTFKIKMSNVSSTSYARAVNKKYMSIYRDQYNKDIDLFLKNELFIDESLDDSEQLQNFKDFLLELTFGKDRKVVFGSFENFDESDYYMNLCLSELFSEFLFSKNFPCTLNDFGTYELNETYLEKNNRIYKIIF